MVAKNYPQTQKLQKTLFKRKVAWGNDSYHTWLEAATGGVLLCDRCFPVNIAKLMGTTILKKHLRSAVCAWCGESEMHSDFLGCVCHCLWLCVVHFAAHFILGLCVCVCSGLWAVSKVESWARARASFSEVYPAGKLQ